MPAGSTFVLCKYLPHWEMPSFQGVKATSTWICPLARPYGHLFGEGHASWLKITSEMDQDWKF
jgi:hypothetical protein